MDHYQLWVDGAQLKNVPAGSCSASACAFTRTLGGGSHGWFVKAFDTVGNARTSVTWSFVVDATSPAVFSLVSPADGATNLPARPTFSWKQTSDSGSGMDHYELWIDGAGTSTSPPVRAPEGRARGYLGASLTTGSHAWTVKAFDRAGNSTSSSTRHFNVS